jgi:putrescine aminotransferase
MTAAVTVPAPADAPAVLDAIRRHFSPGLALGFKLAGQGAVEVRADGARVELSDGREVVDFGSYAVTLLGHRPPSVVAAVAEQLERMPTATRTLANPAAAGLAADLARRCGEPLDRVWLGSDGSDAVEVAVKLARRRSGRMRVLAVAGAFHGKTLGALALTAAPAFRSGVEELLGHVTHVAAGDAGAVRRETARGDVAALVVEPIQGEGGVRPLAPALLRRWSADAHAAGAFVISDEIQCGLRRCGPFSPAVELGLQPDAVLFGKALGGGVLPLSAMVATAELHAPLAADPTWHTATFGGHPLSCAAGRAALAAIDALEQRGREVGATVARGLSELARAHPAVVTEVRGAGLLWGVELATPGLAGEVLVELARRGVLVSPCLGAPRTIRLLPPIVTSDDELDFALQALGAALDAAQALSVLPPIPEAGGVDTATGTRDLVREIVVELAPQAPAAVSERSRLVADLGYDSLALLELAAALEHELALPALSADDATGVETLGDVQALVVRALGSERG